MNIQILGACCKKCETLLENAKTAAMQVGIDARITKVTDMAEMAKLGVLIVPTLVVDGKPYSPGRVLKVEEIVKILKP